MTVVESQRPQSSSLTPFAPQSTFAHATRDLSRRAACAQSKNLRLRLNAYVVAPPRTVPQPAALQSPSQQEPPVAGSSLRAYVNRVPACNANSSAAPLRLHPSCEPPGLADGTHWRKLGYGRGWTHALRTPTRSEPRRRSSGAARRSQAFTNIQYSGTFRAQTRRLHACLRVSPFFEAAKRNSPSNEIPQSAS